MTPPPVGFLTASPSLDRPQASAPAAAVRAARPRSLESQAATADRGAPGSRRLDRAPCFTCTGLSCTGLSCIWRVGRTGELALRLTLPAHRDEVVESDRSSALEGELVFDPGGASGTHDFIPARGLVCWSAARRWRVEARLVGDGEFELALREHGPADAGCPQAFASLSLISRARGCGEVEDASPAHPPLAPAPLILTSIPEAIGLRGGTYVLRASSASPLA
jgi:hypothetical protein